MFDSLELLDAVTGNMADDIRSMLPASTVRGGNMSGQAFG